MHVLVALTLAAQASATGSSFDVDKIRDSVVLLITVLDDQSVSYGSGVVVNDDGLVLTNLHVLQAGKPIRALPYDPAAPSYAAIDGGLSRVLFERERELIAARFVRGDPTLDLALVQLEKIPRAAKPLPIAPEPPRVGDLVVAVGHPEQNLWTMTRGQVSAVHSGYIQHDAAVNKGNSGGPLIDADGRVVGINTSIVKGAQGIFYARPMSVAKKLVDVVAAPFALKRDNPRDAATSCARARELGLPEYSQCVDWGSHYDAFVTIVGSVRKAESRIYRTLLDGKGGPKTRARQQLDRWFLGAGRAETWVQHYGRLMHTWNTSDDPIEVGRAADMMLAYLMDASRGGKAPQTPAKPAPTRTMSPDQRRDTQLRVLELSDKLAHEYRTTMTGPGREPVDLLGVTLKEAEEDAYRRWGLKVAVSDVVATRALLRNGVRVDDVKVITPDRAWVAQSGRNFDGSVYRFSSYWSRWPDGRWQERLASVDEAKTLPKGFPEAGHFGLGPAAMVHGMAMVLVPVMLVVDRPDGIAIDFDFEHQWPVLLEIMAGRDEVLKEHRNRLAAVVNAQGVSVSSR